MSVWNDIQKKESPIICPLCGEWSCIHIKSCSKCTFGHLYNSIECSKSFKCGCTICDITCELLKINKKLLMEIFYYEQKK